jgi:hypothetical protein
MMATMRVLPLFALALASCTPRATRSVENRSAQSSTTRDSCRGHLSFELRDEYAKRPSAVLPIEVVFDGDVKRLIDAGFPLDSPFAGLAFGYLTFEQSCALAAQPGVRGVRLQGRSHPI